MKIFYAKINWFNEYEEEDRDSSAIIVAEDYSEAMRKIEHECFTYVNSIEMRELSDECSSVIFLPNDKADEISRLIENENNY